MQLIKHPIAILIFCLFNLLAKSQTKKEADGLNKKFFLLSEKGFTDIFKNKKIKWYEDYNLGEVAYLYNKKKTEILELIHSPGGGRYDFMGFNLFKANSEFKKIGLTIVEDSFFTNSGFSLNMEYSSKEQKFKQYKKTIKGKGFFVLYKEIDLGLDYFQKLYFRENKLYRIYFGYKNP